jgi:hypothetical protein
LKLEKHKKKFFYHKGWREERSICLVLMLFSRIKTPFGDFDQIVSVETLQVFAAQ